MDWFNRWLEAQTQTPAGSILIFLAVFLCRIAVDRWLTRRENRNKKKQEGTVNG